MSEWSNEQISTAANVLTAIFTCSAAVIAGLALWLARRDRRPHPTCILEREQDLWVIKLTLPAPLYSDRLESVEVLSRGARLATGREADFPREPSERADWVARQGTSRVFLDAYRHPDVVGQAATANLWVPPTATSVRLAVVVRSFDDAARKRTIRVRRRFAPRRAAG